ncbi:MAG TPA: LysM peptidoglycan-binding domain-containing protein [Metalysinibacillus jejuensis]|uniref:LysM peptidoglycan-binding domain-containing protein n=1 Tax=Metalysinibacillus jejuensis TaxID=914327 RepID=A0A921T592_9BACL|nr:3D domain-containing protein [Metalysinibacillus jejuensis]HJH11136.1 LysM peptidoglycan-binding domain-containing protein [Metalysinibacillus jejuensis]
MKNKIVALIGALLFSAGIYASSASAAEAPTHIVQPGETLWSISKVYGTTIEELQKMNNLQYNLVYPTQKLVVGEAPKEPVVQAPAPVKPSVETINGKEVARTLRVSATAYTAYCYGCSGITATGINLRANPNLKVIAVDPRVIPLGSRVWVEGYGEAIAGDTGGAIKGNRIDVFINNTNRAYAWGRKMVTIKVLK